MMIKRVFICLLCLLWMTKLFAQLQTYSPSWGSNWSYTFTGLNPNKAYKLKVSGQYRPSFNNNAWERDAAFEFNTNGSNVTPYLLSQNPNSTGNGNCDGRWTLNGSCQPYPTQRLYNTYFPPTYDFWIPLNSATATVAFWAVNPSNSAGNSFKFDLYERICPIAGYNYAADTIVVKGVPASYTLDAGNGFATYNWSAGTGNIFQATTQTYPVTRQFGWYRSMVTDANGCVGSKSHYVTMLKAKLLQHDTTICSATPITLTADTSGMISTYAPASLVGYNGPFVNNAGSGNTYFYSAANTSWTNANAAVSANPAIMQNGGHLATINSLQENTYIRSIVPTTNTLNNSPDYIWFGLYQDTLSPFYAEESGGWINASGEPFTYANWKTGEPNNQQGGPGAENYAQIWYDSTSWNDKYNAFNSPHVIEFEKRNITYLWSTGATTPTITVNPSVTTKYWFRVTDGAAVVTDTITITVLVPVKDTITVSGCNGQTVYNGITYNFSTVLSQTIKNINGCDSVYRTVNINVTPITPVTNSNTVSGCNSVTYKTIIYTTSAVLRDTVKSVQGCDSIYNIVNINVTTIVPKNQDSVFSGCNSVTYNGTAYNSSTVLNSTIKSVQGCDSIYKTVHINVTPIVPKNQDSVFSGCNTVNYKGTSYNSSTVLNSTIKSVQGCDSIYKTIHINVNTIVPVNQDSVFSGCTSVTYNGITYNNSTVLNSTIKSYQGCDSVYKKVHINVGSLVPVVQDSTFSSCNSVTYNGTVYKSSTVINSTIKSIQGCDSIYKTIHINVTPIVPVNQDSTFSGCNSVTYSGTAYSSSTVLNSTIKSKQGCDSIYKTIHINVTPIIAITNSSTVTGCNSVTYNGTVYSTSTVLNSTIKSIQGCDSIYNVVNIVISSIVPSIKTLNLFDCSSVTYQGNIYQNSTIVKDTLKSYQGCDSVYVLANITVGMKSAYAYIPNYNSNNVSVINTATNAIIATIPVGNNPYGVSASLDGLRVYITNNSSNNVSVINTSNNTVMATIPVGNAPEGISVSPDGSKVYVANSHSNSISVISTSTNTVTSTILVAISPLFLCISADGLTLYFNNGGNQVGVINTLTNTVISTIKVGTGCAGMVISQDGTRLFVANIGSNNVSVINTSNNTVIATIAVGHTPQEVSISADGTKLYTTNYTDNTVSVISTLNNTLIATIGIGINPVGLSWSDVGSIYAVNSNGNSVSVISTLNNTVIATIPVGNQPIAFGNFIASFSKKAANDTININSCNSVVYNGTTYTSSTVLKNTVKSVQGCDSIYNVVNINVTPIVPVTKTVTFSGCNSVVYNGNTYNSSTVLNSTIKSIQGCDSIYNVVNIIVTPIVPVTKSSTYSGCNTVLYNGITYNASTRLNNTIKSVQGCDSIYEVINIDVTPVIAVTKSATFSGCNSVVYNGITYNSSTVLNTTIKSIQGCDSIYNVVNIKVTPIVPVVQNTTWSGCTSVTHNGIIYTTSTVTKDTLKSVQGCDSVYHVINIVIFPKPVVSVTIPKVVCVGSPVTATYPGSVNNIASANWTMGNGNTQSAIYLNYTYPKFGFYNVSVVFTDTSGCVSDPVKKIVNVLPGPYLGNLYDTTVLSGTTFQFNGLTNETLSSIQWQPATDLSSDNVLDPVCSPSATTNYTVRIVDTFGCATIASIKVKVLNIPAIPNTFSPNGDGDHDKWVFGNLTVDDNIEVKVFDRNGQIVYTNYKYDNLWDGTRGGQPLPMGTYYYIIKINKLYSVTGWVLIIR